MSTLSKEPFPIHYDPSLQELLGSNDLIPPAYYGRSILNIPASAAELLAVEGFKSPPLDKELIDPIRGNTK
ncbi:MAG: hypothetical protein MUP11_13880, partial [Anaerolineales bacterium]|nr:hypothetical protein [Anaerolineales bacterium]